MIKRIIALAIALSFTAVLQADYFLIRVDLSQPLKKSGGAAGGVANPGLPGGGGPLSPGGPMGPMGPGGMGGPGKKGMGFEGAGSPLGKYGYGDILSSDEFSISSRYIFAVVELNKRTIATSAKYPAGIVDEANNWVGFDDPNNPMGGAVGPGGKGVGSPVGPGGPGGLGGPVDPAAKAEQKKANWYTFEHPYTNKGKTFPLLTTSTSKADYNGIFFVPNSTLELHQVIYDDFKNPKAMPSIFTTYSDKLKKADLKNIPKIVENHGFALEHGLLKTYEKAMDEILKTDKGSTPVVKNYGETKKKIDNKAKPNPFSNDINKSLPSFKTETSEHFELLHDGTSEDSTIKAWKNHLENTYASFFHWFALQGTVLPPPENKLQVIITTKPTDYQEMHLVMLGKPAVSQGFVLPRENLLVLCTARFDSIYEMFKVNLTEWENQGYNFDDLLAGDFKRGVKVNNNPDLDYVFGVHYAGTLSLLKKSLNQEAIWNTVGRFGSLQLLYATNVLPRNVNLPGWFQEGICGVFETPSCSPWVVYGGANNLHLPRFRKAIKDDKVKKDLRKAPATVELVKAIVEENYFKAGKTILAEEQFKTDSWAMVYFLLKKRQKELMEFCKDLHTLPRDVELKGSIVSNLFIKRFLGGNPANYSHFRDEWMEFLFSGTNFEGEVFFGQLREIQKTLQLTHALDSMAFEPNRIMQILFSDAGVDPNNPGGGLGGPGGPPGTGGPGLRGPGFGSPPGGAGGPGGPPGGKPGKDR